MCAGSRGGAKGSAAMEEIAGWFLGCSAAKCAKGGLVAL